MIIEGERDRLETDLLMISIARKGATEEEREQAFAAWLKRQNAPQPSMTAAHASDFIKLAHPTAE